MKKKKNRFLSASCFRLLHKFVLCSCKRNTRKTCWRDVQISSAQKHFIAQLRVVFFFVFGIEIHPLRTQKTMHTIDQRWDTPVSKNTLEISFLETKGISRDSLSIGCANKYLLDLSVITMINRRSFLIALCNYTREEEARQSHLVYAYQILVIGTLMFFSFH